MLHRDSKLVYKVVDAFGKVSVSSRTFNVKQIKGKRNLTSNHEGTARLIACSMEVLQTKERKRRKAGSEIKDA